MVETVLSAADQSLPRGRKKVSHFECTRYLQAATCWEVLSLYNIAAWSEEDLFKFMPKDDEDYPCPGSQTGGLPQWKRARTNSRRPEPSRRERSNSGYCTERPAKTFSDEGDWLSLSSCEIIWYARPSAVTGELSTQLWHPFLHWIGIIGLPAQSLQGDHIESDYPHPPG